MKDLLPQLAAVQVAGVEVGRDLLRITARTWDDAEAACPACGQVSDWVHSRYERHVADEAVGGRTVVIDLDVVSFGESAVADEAAGDGGEREEVFGLAFVAAV
ncbi:transposase family protein [Streptomyces sp. NPDC003480]